MSTELIRIDLLAVVKDDGSSSLHDGEHHDGAQLPPHRHGHVGKGWQLVHELQQLLWGTGARQKEDMLQSGKLLHVCVCV